MLAAGSPGAIWPLNLKPTAVAEHRLIPARARNVTTQLRQAGISSVWAPSCQDITPGHAGVEVVSRHGAPLSLPTIFTPSLKAFFSD